MLSRVAPELRSLFQSLPERVLSTEALPEARLQFARLLEVLQGQLPEVPSVAVEDRRVPGPAGSPDVLVRIYRPTNATGPLPALIWIHGGGYVVGTYTQEDRSHRQMAADVGCLVVSVEYRLAPESPFPAALEDCYAALRYVHRQADELGVDRRRIAVGGASAGGGLAACVALAARDRNEVPLPLQLLIYPMLDDRSVTHSAQVVVDPRVWNRQKNLFAWDAYLAGANDVSCYAAASRAIEVAGLAPAYIAIGDLDLFVDEDLEYARRLIQAGVPTELHIVPGAFHGFDVLAPLADISRRFLDLRDSALRAAFSRG